MELRTALAEGHARLAAAGVPSPSADAALLTAQVLGIGRAELSRRVILGYRLDGAEEARWSELISLRAERVPLQHLTGTAPFRRLELQVGPGVFVPRAETELVAGLAIEEAFRLVAAGQEPLVVDLCTGSGAIALAIASEVPQARCVAVELSRDALAWAARNVDGLGLGHASTCVRGTRRGPTRRCWPISRERWTWLPRTRRTSHRMPSRPNRRCATTIRRSRCTAVATTGSPCRARSSRARPAC